MARGAGVGVRSLATAVLAAIGVTAVLRQRREATRVRDGSLDHLGPGGQPADLPSDALHRAVAAWRPARPRSPVGRALATLWSLPGSVAGLTLALLGGGAVRRDRERSVVIARQVGGPFGWFLRGQGADAATLGQVVVATSAAPSAGLLDHEVVHVRQQERLGPLFALAYPLAQARWGYRANPFEVAARAGATRAPGADRR